MLPPKIIQIDYLNNQGYVIADILEGGMGKVYKLFPVLDDIPVVAMKTIKGESSIKLFDEECESWLSIAHHPNVAKSFAFGAWEGLPSIIVEWYPFSLDKLEPKSIDIESFIRLASGTTNALLYAYEEKKLIHQDIKPANILIDDHGNARLGDFGLAKCLTENSSKPFENMYGRKNNPIPSLSGTPYFMSPELWDGASASIKTDIFSLGVTFYNVLTGEHPYIEITGSKRTLHNEIRMDALTDFVNQHGNEAEPVLHFLKRCLALDPAHRYANYSEALNDLGAHAYKEVDEWTIDKSRSVANVAAFYINKGDKDKALSILERTLEKRPNDVILISQLASIYSHIGNNEEAELYSGIAFNNLSSVSGIFLGEYDPSPAMVWVRNLINRKRHEEAANVIKSIFGWEKGLVKNDRASLSSARYAEVGWYFLYTGDFDKAFDILIRNSLRNILDKQSSVWLIETAWLSGSIKKFADEIADKILKLTPATLAEYGGELEFVWARVVLGQYVNTELKSRLWKSSSSSLFVETSKLEKQYGIKSGALLIPSSSELQKPFIFCLDQISTGGIHREFIESF